ncbi:MAG: aldo/keto reductase [Candidatus Latescibacteria bacterium]|nr:aldo/keto reductase [Candidatus Latescibacterota bacterium]
MNRKTFITRSTAGLVGLGITVTSKSHLTYAQPEMKNIQYRTLGRTGLKVSAVGFGASRATEPSLIKKVVDTGVNLLDTGRMYSGGRNEELIGRVIKDIRETVVIQSKIHQNIQHDPKAMEKSIDDSLKALRTDYIDIMLLRWTADKDAIDNPDAIEALTKAKKAGKILFTGFSCHNNQAEIIRAAIENGFYDVALTAYNHAGNYTHSQSGNYSEWDQPALEIELEKASTAGIGIVAIKTCSGGPYKAEGETEASYTSALKWILNNKNISSVVPAMANFREVEEDVRAMNQV